MIVCSLLAAAAPCSAGDLPEGFVYLRDIDETIVEDIKYATNDNFLGRPLNGYKAPSCILVEGAARALASLQVELRQSELTLVVFDCYRPAQAVADMVAHVTGNDQSDPFHYPNLKANQLLRKGYIAQRSGHSSGGSVDLTIAHTAHRKTKLLNMGTRFDFFDPLSQTETSAVSETAQINRRYLKTVMHRAGFRNYPREWWHFRYVNEPFRGTIFDFPVIDRH